jgi:hypothetical protein
VLSQKKVFRMSGPVVAIGFILLIPSFIGMLYSAFLLIRASTAPQQLYQSQADAEFRGSCKTAFDENSSDLPGISASQFCECELRIYRSGYSPEAAATICYRRGLDGDKFAKTDPDVEAFYSGAALTDAGRGYMSSVAIVMGITSFVGGLLGWLLVMKKRILQCTLCGAVVNAS